MTWTVVSSGSGQIKTSGTSLSTDTGVSATAGDTIIFCVAFDNLSYTTPTVSSISKPAGETNNWTITQFMSPSNSAAGGAKGAVGVIVATVDWGGTTRTVTLSSAVTAKTVAFVVVNGGTIGTPVLNTAVGDLAIGDWFAAFCFSEEASGTSPSGLTVAAPNSQIQTGTGSVSISTSGSGSASNISGNIRWIGSGGISITGQTTGTPDGTGTPVDGAMIIIPGVAASGPYTYQASGTHAASTAVAGAVLATLLAAGSTAASTTLSGDPTVHLGTQSASGTVPAASGGSGAPISRLLSSGTSAASAGSTGAVVLKSPAAGTSAATATTSGSPTIRLGTLPAAGTVAASAGTAGTVVTKSQAAGVNAASATVSGTLTARLLAAGTSAATSTTVSGDVQIYSTIKVASGTITVTTATTGAVITKSQAAGTSAVTAGAAGSVFTIRPGAAGVITGVSALSGDPTKVLGAQTYSAAGTVLVIAGGSGAVRAYMRVTGQSVVSASTAGTLVARFKANGTNPAVVTTVGSPTIYGVAPALGYWGVRI